MTRISHDGGQVWIPACDTADFLRVGVAAALVAAVRDEPERGQAPRLRRGRDGTRFALALAIAALALLQASAAAAAVSRVAVVLSSRIGPFEEAGRAVEEHLKRRIVQPEILVFDLEGNAENGGRVFAQVRAAVPSLIMPVGTLATEVVLSWDLPIPVVFSMVLYPQQSGFLARPGHEVTGSSLDIPVETQFRMLRRLVPTARRIGVLYNRQETGAIVEAAQAVAARLGLQLEPQQVERPENALGAMEALVKNVDAMWSIADSHVFTPETTAALILATLRARLPLFGLSAAQVRSGALAALSCDYAANGEQAAELALRVLSGERASTIAPAVPAKVALSLNLRTARHLGLPIDSDIEREGTVVVR